MYEPYVAICPECDKRRNLKHFPSGDGLAWPHCEDCGESMNVYERQRKSRAQMASQQERRM